MAKLNIEIEVDVQKLNQQLEDAVRRINDELGKAYSRSGVGGIAPGEAAAYEGLARMDEMIQRMTQPGLIERLQRWYMLQSGGAGGFLAVVQNIQRGFVNSLMRVYQAVGIVLAVEILKRLEQYFGRFSGYLQAAVQLIDVFVNLMFKPIADIFGVIMLPLLVPVIQLLAEILPRWNEAVAQWMQGPGSTPLGGLAYLGALMGGYRQGGIFGALLGGLLVPFLYQGTGALEEIFGINIPDWAQGLLTAGVAGLGGGTLANVLKELTGIANLGLSEVFKELKENVDGASKALEKIKDIIFPKGEEAAGGKEVPPVVAAGGGLGRFGTVLGIAGIIGAEALLGYTMLKASEVLTERLQEEGRYEQWLSDVTGALTELGAPGVVVPTTASATEARTTNNITVNVEVNKADDETIANKIVDAIKSLFTWGG